jgi:serine/threonine-protein kinase
MIGRKIQNYKIISVLGKGGMGIVYKAFDIKLERYAALKILNINSTRYSYIIERFRKEARNQARLSHPNIVSVYGFVEERNVMGIAMEYIEGNTIENILMQNGRMDYFEAINLMVQILNGIEYAHTEGFIHRDLKPSNIIIDAKGSAKIMDFGISKSIDEIESITMQDTRPGTLLYMSPEQLSGEEITIKSDVYSLGITFYEMLTNTHPYNSKTFYELIDAQVNKIPNKISEIYPDIPQELDVIILRAIGKSSSSNFNYAYEFRQELELLISQLKVNPLMIYSSKKKGKKQVDKKKSTIFQKILNFILALVFLVLMVFVYDIIRESIEKSEIEKNPLTYSQDYSKNPNYINKTKWNFFNIGTEKNLFGVLFTDNFNGFICGESGLLLKTIDGGLTWQKININFSQDLYRLYKSGEKIFLLGGGGGLFVLSATLKEWEKINLDITEMLFDIFFIDDNVGIITGSNGIILKTNDGGLTWNKINSSVNKNLFSIAFSDKKAGLIVGWDGTILRTEDSGENWERVKTDFNSYLRDIVFINEFLGFIVGGEGKVLRTENAGRNWDDIKIESSSGLYKIIFDSFDNGMILSNRGEIFSTSDGGKTWTSESLSKPIIFNDIQRLSSGNYVIVGNNGQVFKSKQNID